MNRISGNIVDVLNSRTYPGTLEIDRGKIRHIVRESRTFDRFIIPPLIDAHVHIESSMLVPSEFARLAVRHGTVATVSDPHEIANVMGVEGVDFMLANGNSVDFKFFFGAPSCVPATPFETAGHVLDAEMVASLLGREEIYYLSEMMNFPGVIGKDPDVMQKIEAARKVGKPIDGHAPGLTGWPLEDYVSAGITTDHEAYTREEAREKLALGMKILIREGSAAKNFDTLIDLIETYPDDCMLCSDDKHPDDLIHGHINELVKRALASGHDKMKVLRAASVNPVRHYGLDVGLLQMGDPADFVVIDGFDSLDVMETWIDGQKVAENGETLLPHIPVSPVNLFNTEQKEAVEFQVPYRGNKIAVIGALNGQLVTEHLRIVPTVRGGCAVADTDRDILKLAVVNRYANTPPAVGFIKNFGLKKGAMASSVAHDSHNIVAVGTSDEALARAVNLVIRNKGGLCAVSDDTERLLPLQVAGLMATEDGFSVARKYARLDAMTKALGATLDAPFMTLSFMSLLVIPSLKLSDKGLFDGEKFAFIP